MKRFNIKLTFLPLAVALASCASLAPNNNPLAGNSPQAEQAKHDTKVAALKGCAVGAGAGALLGILHGNFKQGIEYAVGGCAVGGVIAGGVEYKKQLDQANALAEQARENGATAQVQTSMVAIENKDGEATKVPRFDQLTIQFTPYKTLRHYPSVAATAVKAAKMAADSTIPVHINVEGPSAERQWLMQVMAPALTNPKTTISESFATTPGLVLSPVPNIKAG